MKWNAVIFPSYQRTILKGRRVEKTAKRPRPSVCPQGSSSIYVARDVWTGKSDCVYLGNKLRLGVGNGILVLIVVLVFYPRAGSPELYGMGGRVSKSSSNLGAKEIILVKEK